MFNIFMPNLNSWFYISIFLLFSNMLISIITFFSFLNYLKNLLSLVGMSLCHVHYTFPSFYRAFWFRLWWFCRTTYILHNQICLSFPLLLINSVHFKKDFIYPSIIKVNSFLVVIISFMFEYLLQLPAESHGQLSGYSPWGHTESYTTEVT